MKFTERIMIYSALTVLAALNGVFLLSHSGRTAFAETAAYLADVLGPAEAVKLVDGDKEITVQNKDGRIAWGDGDFKKTYAVAFVDIGRALNPLMESSEFADEREALRNELEPTEKDFQTRLDSLGQELRGMDQSSPQFRDKVQDYQKLAAEYNKWGQDVALKRRDELDVKHLQKAYKEMAAAVNVVADRLGIDIVLRFIPAENDFKAQNAEQALTEVRLRSAVKYPEKLDITSEVLEELSLQDKGR